MAAELKEKLETPISEIEQFRNTLINDPGNYPETIERVKKATIKKIKDDVFSYSVDGKNIKTFFKKNGEAYLLTDTSRKLPFFENILGIVGVVEKDNNGVYEMYKKEGGNKSNPILRKIDINSTEYFEIWKEIDFYNFHSITEAGKKGDDKINRVREGIVDVINLGIRKGTLRIKDLLSYMKKGEKEVEPYKTTLKKLEQILPQQCLDVRFDKIGDPITNDSKNNNGELEIYLKEGFISKDIYDKCIENLKKKKNDKLEISSFTKKEVSEIQVA